MEEPRYYRIAPEYRRSLIYVAVGLFALVPVAMWVHAFVKRRPPDNVLGCLVVISVGVVLLLAAFRWVLRIDQRGLARRILFWWDRWDWTDLASGRIEKRQSSLVDPQRPWWRRKLRLEWLTSEDRQSVVERINEHYRLPPAPPVPESLRVKYGFRRSVTFDRTGVTLQTRGRLLAYRWDEIRRVHIRRLDAVRRDFAAMEIFLPEEVVELKLVTTDVGTNPTWRGGTAEQINELLFHDLPAERIQEDVTGGPMATREDVERAIAEARKRERGLFHLTWISGAILAGCFLWTVFDRGVLMAAGIVALYLWSVPVLWWMHRDCRKRTLGLKAELVAFQENEAAGT
jgi:hypothetical protein